MTKKRRTKIITEIIREYYQGKYDKETEEGIQKKFLRWINNAKNREEKDKVLMELWEQEKSNSVQLSDEKLNEIMLKMGFNINQFTPKRKTLTFRRVISVSAAVLIPLLILGGGWIYFNNTKGVIGDQVQFKEYIAEWKVDKGEIENIALADSSKVWINSGSKVQVCQNKDQRIVELSGESFFDVTKDTERPFIVKTKELTITVLGTKFNVEAYPDRHLTIVTLEAGKVALSAGEKKWTLEPNQRFIYDKNLKEGVISSLSDSSINFDSEWRTGRLVCKNMTVKDILNAVERKFNLEVEIDPSVTFSKETYNVDFHATDTPSYIMDALGVMNTGEKFNYVVNGNKIIISKP